MDLADGESTTMQGSGSKPYVLKNTGGVYQCSCPAWRNQSVPVERRTCKHLRKLRGDAAEAERIAAGAPLAELPSVPADKGEGAPVLLAERWDTAADLTGWWMSEKLDGVRAWWDGARLWSRQGNPLHAPEGFVAGLPPTPLDGELWVGRKAFQRTVGIVRRQDHPPEWRDVRFLLFDAPTVGGGFEERLAWLTASAAGWGAPQVEVLPHVRCEGTAHLATELARVEALGGEGLMLREPGSVYVVGRSSTLLKVKTFHDAEAVVVGHEPGRGRHKGRLGALVAQLPDGTTFSVGTGFSDREREAPPAIGDTITFRYQELTDGGVPRFPSFVRRAVGGRG